MGQRNFKILMAALIFGALAFVVEALIDLLLHPAKPIFSFPAVVVYERVLQVIFVMVSVAIAVKTFSLHQQSKEALWEGENLLESIFDSVQDGLLVKDRDFRIMRFNQVAAHWFDFAMPIQGRKCYEALKGRQSPCLDCPTIKALDTGEAAHAIVPKPGPGGSEKGWLELYAYPLVDSATGEINGVIEFARDITLRKEAEDALHESETRYRLLLNNIPAVAFKGYMDWSIEFIDDKIEELSGYSKEEFNSRRLKWRDLILPEDLKGAQEIFQQALKSTKAYVREYRIRHKDGHILWIQARGQIICDLAGQVEYVYGVFFDITDRRRAEEALRKSRASLAEAQHLARLGNWEWHIPDHEVLWSDEVYRLLGQTPGQITPSFETYMAAVHPEDRTLVRRAFSNTLDHKKPFHLGHRVIRADGAERFLYAQAELFYDDSGQPLKMMGTIQDVTERRRAEEALAESERRYRLLAENVSDIIWTMDLQMNLTFVSPSIQRFTGYEPKEYMELPHERIFPPGSYEMARSALAEELARAEEPGRSITLQMEMFRKDGSTGWVEIQASLLRDDEGRPVGVMGVSRDISARRKLEAQLQQAQKMEVVGRLAGGIAHDFNNLLTAILGYSEILATDLKGREPAFQELMEIKKAGERAALLTRQLLAFSRRQVLQPKSLSLNLVIENLSKMLQRVIGEDIRLEIIPGPDLGLVMADPGQMEQVVLNLTVNARDAMPRGGRLRLQTANVTLDETFSQGHAQVQPGPYVLLEVNDTGFGMDAETRSHIFEPFFTTKEKGKGTGLGLSTVYGIVHQSGGYIWVYSELGQGTVFKIFFPRVAAETQTAATVKEPEESYQGRETILLVEDEDMVREIAALILKRNGYQVLEAREGEAAIRFCQEYRGDIDLVLTDLVMPGINGRDLVPRLTRLRPGLKVVLMSGYAEEGILDRELLEGGVGFIQKPFEAGTLARKIREVLSAI